MRSTSVTVSILLVLTACLTCTNAGPVAQTVTQTINVNAGATIEKSVVGINSGTINIDSDRDPATTSFKKVKCITFEQDEICTCDRGYIYVHSPSPSCSKTAGSDFQDMFCLKSSGKCFKYMKDIETWDEADQTCKAENLKLAQPEFPLKIRNYLTSDSYKLGGVIDKGLGIWLGAKGDDKMGQQWIGTTVILGSTSKLFYNPVGINHSSNCLVLVTHERKITTEPGKPLDVAGCNNTFNPVLCEK